MRVRPDWSCISYIFEVSADPASFSVARPGDEVKVSEDKWKLKLRREGGRVLVRKILLEIFWIRSCYMSYKFFFFWEEENMNLDPGGWMSKGQWLRPLPSLHCCWSEKACESCLGNSSDEVSEWLGDQGDLKKSEVFCRISASKILWEIWLSRHNWSMQHVGRRVYYSSYQYFIIVYWMINYIIVIL